MIATREYDVNIFLQMLTEWDFHSVTSISRVCRELSPKSTKQYPVNSSLWRLERPWVNKSKRRAKWTFECPNVVSSEQTNNSISHFVRWTQGVQTLTFYHHLCMHGLLLFRCSQPSGLPQGHTLGNTRPPVLVAKVWLGSSFTSLVTPHASNGKSWQMCCTYLALSSTFMGPQSASEWTFHVLIHTLIQMG